MEHRNEGKKNFGFYMIILFITLAASVLLINPFAYIFLVLLMPFVIFKNNNKIVRDLLLTIPLYIYLDIWSLAFLGLALAGHFFGGFFQKYCNLWVYSIVFSVVAIYFAFEGHPIGKVLFGYDWRYAPLEAKEIFWWSLPIYAIMLFVVNSLIGNKEEVEDSIMEPTDNYTNEQINFDKPQNNYEKPEKKKEKIDPNNASFDSNNKVFLLEEWVRNDKTE